MINLVMFCIFSQIGNSDIPSYISTSLWDSMCPFISVGSRSAEMEDNTA